MPARSMRARLLTRQLSLPMSSRVLTAQHWRSLCRQHTSIPGASLSQLLIGEHDGIALGGGKEVGVSGHTCQVGPIVKCFQQAEIARAISAGLSTQAGCIRIVGRFVGEHIGGYLVGIAIPDVSSEWCLSHRTLLFLPDGSV